MATALVLLGAGSQGGQNCSKGLGEALGETGHLAAASGIGLRSCTLISNNILVQFIQALQQYIPEQIPGKGNGFIY